MKIKINNFMLPKLIRHAFSKLERTLIKCDNFFYQSSCNSIFHVSYRCNNDGMTKKKHINHHIRKPKKKKINKWITLMDFGNKQLKL